MFNKSTYNVSCIAPQNSKTTYFSIALHYSATEPTSVSVRARLEHLINTTTTFSSSPVALVV